MRPTLASRALPAAALAAILSICSITAAGAAEPKTGTLTVGDDTWTVVPAIQCGVYPGNMVAIAGHAAGNEAIEIVLDHDPSSGLVGVRVQGPDDSPHWVARDDDVSFEIDGETVKGGGTFKLGFGAQPVDGKRMAEGSFEITC